MANLRIGVFGGTFDPPHNGHLALAKAAQDQLGLERVIWIPAGDPWRKEAMSVSAAEHRLAMLRCAIEGEAAWEVDSSEVQRPGPTYAVGTLRQLKEKHPAAELVFLLGADALEDLRHWHEPEELIKLCLLGATSRKGIKPEDATLESWLPGLSSRVLWFDMPRTDVSATGIRHLAAAGERLGGLVPPAVEKYIARNRLYGAA